MHADVFLKCMQDTLNTCQTHICHACIQPESVLGSCSSSTEYARFRQVNQTLAGQPFWLNAHNRCCVQYHTLCSCVSAADLYVGYVNTVPHGSQEAVCKSHDQHILHQLLTQVMINSASRQAIGLAMLWRCIEQDSFAEWITIHNTQYAIRNMQYAGFQSINRWDAVQIAKYAICWLRQYPIPNAQEFYSINHWQEEYCNSLVLLQGSGCLHSQRVSTHGHLCYAKF